MGLQYKVRTSSIEERTLELRFDSPKAPEQTEIRGTFFPADAGNRVAEQRIVAVHFKLYIIRMSWF